MIFVAASLLDSGPTSRAILASLRDPVVSVFARGLFGVDVKNGSASVRIAIAQQIAACVVAALIASAWSLRSRRREYRRLHGWFRIALRYYVGVVMSIYGGLKLIPTQFPPIPLEQLSEPLGNFSPMALLWAYMGYSSIYTSFAGFGECAGAFLLFFRRTTTAGALILIAVLSNVALINYVYDVPVKQLSMNLLLASILLAATDARRILDVFVRNVSPRSADLSFPLGPRQRRLQAVVRPILILGATLGPLTASYFVRRNVVQYTPPLYGVYDVVRFERNGIEAPPLMTDSTRWTRVTFSRSRSLSIRFARDRAIRITAAVDTGQHRVRLDASASSLRATTLAYRVVGVDSLAISGRFGNDSISALLQRLDPRRAFRLAR